MVALFAFFSSTLEETLAIVAVMVAIGSPLWIPIVFVGYAIGCKRFSLLTLFVFFTAEAISIATVAWLISVR